VPAEGMYKGHLKICAGIEAMQLACMNDPRTHTIFYPLVVCTTAGQPIHLKFISQSPPKNTCKLTWLVLGGDPPARSHRVEQFTAL
jgi:hypothetical protein